MDTLSRREEDALLKSTKERALRECDGLVKEFAECASGRTVSVAWACRGNLKNLQACMSQYTSPAEMERMRAEYIRLRGADSSSSHA